MKLILTHEVTGLGEPGDIVEVKDGFGRNYLVPRGFATRWTKGGERQIDSIRAARSTRSVRDLDHATQIKAQLEQLTVPLPVQASNTGRLFGAVSVGDIVEAVTAAGGPSLDRRRVEVSAPIRSTGTHTATVRLHPEVVGTVTLEVAAA